MVELLSREDIHAAAVSLARHLEKHYEDVREGEYLTGRRWTEHVFEMLRNFCESELGLNPSSDCFHQYHPDGKIEFLWDFIGTSLDRGVILAAESEQATTSDPQIISLQHDFGKLLYVFAPIRLLICKSKSREHSAMLLDRITEYAKGCCLNFNPGATFVIHFCLHQDAGAHSYLWQSAGAPNRPEMEPIAFAPISSHI